MYYTVLRQRREVYMHKLYFFEQFSLVDCRCVGKWQRLLTPKYAKCELFCSPPALRL